MFTRNTAISPGLEGLNTFFGGRRLDLGGALFLDRVVVKSVRNMTILGIIICLNVGAQ